MPYTILKADGTTLVTVADNTTVTTYSTAFVGKGQVNYGESINNNFLRLLEKFIDIKEGFQFTADILNSKSVLDYIKNYNF